MVLLEAVLRTYRSLVGWLAAEVVVVVVVVHVDGYPVK